MKIFLSFILLVVSANAFAQEVGKPWSLQECIDYALNNNIQMQQNLLNEKSAEVTLLQSKAQLLPSLNGNATNSYNQGRKVDPFTNQFVSNAWTLSQNFSVSSNLTIFNGFQNINTIKQSQYSLQASKEDVRKIANDISLNIASAYLQILLTQELLYVAQNQAELTHSQENRIKKLVEVGNLPKGNLLDVQAQLANEEVYVVNAENNLSLAKLNLTQMLNLDTVENFSIVRPEIALQSDVVLNTTSGQIYDAALTRQPEIKSAEFKLRSAKKGVSIARSGMYPRLVLSGGYGTGYSGASKQLVGDPTITSITPYGATASGELVYIPVYSYNYEIIPSSIQYENNINKSVGAYLSIPLFNNLQTNTAISKAKLNSEYASLSLQLEKDVLKKTIQQAYNDAVASMKKYKATQKAVSAMEESFKYMDQRFSVGSATSVEYNDAKNKLMKAQSDLLQSKYDCVFKMKVLDFYQGKPITL